MEAESFSETSVTIYHRHSLVAQKTLKLFRDMFNGEDMLALHWTPNLAAHPFCLRPFL